MVGWGLVAAGSVCGIGAAAVKGGKFEALTAASACGRAAAKWGYSTRGPENATAPVLALPGPLKEGGSFVGTRYLGRVRNNGATPLTYSPNAEHPTDVSRWFRGRNLTEVCLWITRS